MSTAITPGRAHHPVRRRVSRLLRRAAPAVVPVAVVLLAAPAAADTPTTWNDPPPMSLLEALLIFGGIPLALVLVISLLVVAPSLVRGDRQQRGVESWTEPQWFGGPGDPLTADGHSGRHEVGTAPTEQSGGASARW